MADVSAFTDLARVAVPHGGLRSALEAVASGSHAVLLVRPGAVVSPFAERFASAVLAAIGTIGSQVVGASLSAPRLRPGSAAPFVPVEDGSDTFFARSVPDAAVLFWPSAAAILLARWRGESDAALLDALDAADAFLLHPRTPLAHDGGKDGAAQRLLPCGPRVWDIAGPQEALAVYDRHWEVTPSTAGRIGSLPDKEPFTVDLWGRTGGEEETPFLLSSRPCRAPIASYPLELVPAEANLSEAVESGFFSFGHWRDFGPMTADARQRLFRHSTRYNAMDDYAAQFLHPLKRLLPGGRG